MSRYMLPSRNNKTVFQVQSVRYATGQTYLKGALVVDNVNGEFVECGADPVSIFGVTLQAAATGPGFDISSSGETTVVTGRNQETSVAVADRDTQFKGRGVSGGTDPVLPLQTHVGEKYGVSKVGNDWVIDFAKTGASARLQITDICTEDNTFLFKFLEANLARP